jgi:membrane protein YdbS with pleckstrin-like domain
MESEESDQNRSVLNWLVTEVVVLAAVLIGLLVMFAADAPDLWIYLGFAVSGFFAVFVLPVWAVWGFPEQ